MSGATRRAGFGWWMMSGEKDCARDGMKERSGSLLEVAPRYLLESPPGRAPDTDCVANAEPGCESGECGHPTRCRYELEHIIREKSIHTLFQPIFDLRSGDVFGLEALSRGPDTSHLHMPDALFCAAREAGRMAALESVCREAAVRRFLEIESGERLFLNVDPLTLMDSSFLDEDMTALLQRAGLPCSSIVIELTEHTRVEDFPELKVAVARYRDKGFAIAMDDLSSGYSNLQLMAELRPDYVKLDAYFTRQLADSDLAREFVRSIINISGRIGCDIIVEGIETSDVLREVDGLGLHLAQGYLLGRPTARPNRSIPEGVWTGSPDMTSGAGVRVDVASPIPANGAADCIVELARPDVTVCGPDDPGETLLQLFERDPALIAIPVIDRGRAIGMVRREPLLRRFAMRFGRELYMRRAARKMMWKAPLIVPEDMPVDEVSRLVTGRGMDEMYTPVIVENADGYVGMVFVHDLLEHMTHSRIARAMDANPLTRLPGNQSIEREVTRRLECGDCFLLCYIDLDNFKAFNDCYGYKRGDAMLELLADILRECLSPEDFIGHVGGDDFVVITGIERENALVAIMDAFGDRSRSLYDEADVERGYISSKDRSGRRCRFPLASLSVGAVPCVPGRFSSHLEAAEVASELKCKAKKTRGNCLEIDRRQPSPSTEVA